MVAVKQAGVHHQIPAGTNKRIFDSAVAERAVMMVMPLILAMYDEGTTKRQHLHIVVGLHGVPLFEYSLGNRSEWSGDYDKIAQSKHKLAAIPGGGGSSAYVQHVAPHLLEEGNTYYWGSVNLDGITVAASGDYAYWDEMWSQMIAAAVKALCKQEVENMRTMSQDFIEFA